MSTSEQHRDIELRSVSSCSSDEPGPSHRHATIASPADHQPPPTITNKEKDGVISSLVSRITIAGIEDAYKAKTKLERYTFLGAIVFGVLAMTYSSFFISMRYSRQDPNVINRMEILEQAAPFPNVTVCLPPMKNPRINELLVFPLKALQQMKKHNVSVEEMLEFMEWGTSAFYGQKEMDNPLKSAIGIKILDASLDENFRVIRDVLKAPCQKSFFKCNFGGNPFDCCSVATYMLLDQGSCWHFDMNTVERTLSSSSSSSGHQHQRTSAAGGLTIDVHIDKRLVILDDNVLPDGFIVHIDQIPSMFSTPEVIPFGADAHIILSEPAQIHQIARCQPNDVNLPRMKRLDYYDPNAVLCAQDKTLQFLAVEAGCDPVPLLTFVPTNETRCDAGMTLGILRALGGAIVLGDLSVSVKEFFTRMDKFGHELQLGAYRSCQPLCNRWSYSVYSSSYGYIQYGEGAKVTHENVSLTRMRVYFQDSAYQQRIEQHSNLFYLAFCEIGGVWGVYLGFSIVSVLQIVAYAFLVWRKRKVLCGRLVPRSGRVNDAGRSGPAAEGPPNRRVAWA